MKNNKKIDTKKKKNQAKNIIIRKITRMRRILFRRRLIRQTRKQDDVYNTCTDKNKNGKSKKKPNVTRMV